jgi:catechol 2,3-dioxygenase-like lactoylglutathione lyase family enzyme
VAAPRRGRQRGGQRHLLAGEQAFVFLGDGERLVLTLWQQSEGTFDARTPGLHHLSFQVDTMEQVRALEARLKQLDARFLYDGVVVHAEGEQSGGVFFGDPDRIRLEICAPTGAAAAPAAAGDAPACGFFQA